RFRDVDVAESVQSGVGNENWFNQMALELFGLQFKYNRAYRQFCEAKGVLPATVKDWSKIPAVPTSGFKELEFSCLAAGDTATVFHSSGTTEQRPSRHFHSEESLGIYEESVRAWFRAGARLSPGAA